MIASRRLTGPGALLCCVLGLSIAVTPARASQTLGDRNISRVSLAVDNSGVALLTYTREDGNVRHVLAWGAVNALAPSIGVPQVKFRMNYTDGRGWQTFQNACRRYNGPPLAGLVVACLAPDGSYWAIQAWQRQLPMRGYQPWTPAQAAVDFTLSHWTGPIADLQVTQNWTYQGQWQALDGRLTYDGNPVYGYKTASDTRSGDGYGRNVFIDTYNSIYGPGWRHDTAIALHEGDGAFCYSFVPQSPPLDYPSTALRGPGNGQLERVTVLGPGVTPDVQWVGSGLGPYDPAQDTVYDQRFDQLVGPDDRACTNER